MDISIIISGNLTGFSRFYASSNANDIYNEAKFDFDYRNFLTFINAGEKAYAISFSPKVIAVSLITRILDSFRRPGILVVTALIPRYQLVSGTLNAQDKSAIYSLLNEINDKFHEKNFLNGMINQNPAVLMQDYYSDILRRYELVSDRMQKAVNTTIDVNSPNKRIGYVSANEEDMPKYLSSLMRKAYNGYHHVFFADKAPANIDEPADEIVTYKVRVSNDNRHIPGEVRLDDRIPVVSPKPGEKPIPNHCYNYTYRQVLNGDAGNDILASLENDTIVLTYRFQQEEKTIVFKFYDGENEVALPVIRPLIVESDGKSYPLSTDSWTFRGKEIYGLKTIRSGNSEYLVDSNSSHIDLQRLREGATHNVYVSKVWTWYFKPTVNGRAVNTKPINITLVNKYTREEKKIPNITGATTESLSGTPQDWDMIIDSDYYEPIRVPATAPFDLKPTPYNQGGGDGSQGSNRSGDGTRSQGSSTSSQGLKVTSGQSNEAKDVARLKEEQKKRYIQYGIYALVAIISCIGGLWVYNVWNRDPNKDDPNKEGTKIVRDDTWKFKNVTFSLEDDSKIEDDNLALLDFTVSSLDSVQIEDGKNSYSKTIWYKPENDNNTISIKVTFNYRTDMEPLTFADESLNVDKLSEDVDNSVVLCVLNSELTSYRELTDNKTIPQKLDKQIKRLRAGNENMKAYAELLENLKNNITGVSTDDPIAGLIDIQQIEQQKNAGEKPTDKKGENNPGDAGNVGTGARGTQDQDQVKKNRFDDLTLVLSPDGKSLMTNGGKLVPNEAEKAQNDALIQVLKELNGGTIPIQIPNALSTEQSGVIYKLKQYHNGLDKSGQSQLKSDLKRKNCKSLHQIQLYLNQKNQNN